MVPVANFSGVSDISKVGSPADSLVTHLGHIFFFSGLEKECIFMISPIKISSYEVTQNVGFFWFLFFWFCD